MRTVTAVTTHDDVTDNAAAGSFAARQRRESRREEWNEHVRLAELLEQYLDPSCTFWTSLENKPLSAVSGVFQRKRGVKSGLPDVLIFQQKLMVFVELKSHRGVASRAQKHIRTEVLRAGGMWWMARTARAAITALQRSGVVFRRKWKPPKLQAWEGPFSDPTQRLPQHPRVAAERTAARQRWRARQHARQSAMLAAERDGARLIDAHDAHRISGVRTTTHRQ
jgi:hypothetical protein